MLREQTNVDVINGCALWAANATAPLMIVAVQRNEHFVLGPRGYIERREGLPAAKLAPGKRLARQRVLRTVAAAKRTHLLPDNQMIPRGGQWVEPAANDDGIIVRVA